MYWSICEGCAQGKRTHPTYANRYKDVCVLQYMLTKRFGFKEEDITILLDDSSDPNAWPTGNNMRHHMRQLVTGAQSGDSLLFHFSGQPPLQSQSNPAAHALSFRATCDLLNQVTCWLVCVALDARAIPGTAIRKDEKSLHSHDAFVSSAGLQCSAMHPHG